MQLLQLFAARRFVHIRQVFHGQGCGVYIGGFRYAKVHAGHFPGRKEIRADIAPALAVDFPTGSGTEAVCIVFSVAVLQLQRPFLFIHCGKVVCAAESQKDKIVFLRGDGDLRLEDGGMHLPLVFSRNALLCAQQSLAVVHKHDGYRPYVVMPAPAKAGNPDGNTVDAVACPVAIIAVCEIENDLRLMGIADISPPYLVVQPVYGLIHVVAVLYASRVGMAGIGNQFSRQAVSGRPKALFLHIVSDIRLQRQRHAHPFRVFHPEGHAAFSGQGGMVGSKADAAGDMIRIPSGKKRYARAGRHVLRGKADFLIHAVPVVHVFLLAGRAFPAVMFFRADGILLRGVSSAVPGHLRPVVPILKRVVVIHAHFVVAGKQYAHRIALVRRARNQFMGLVGYGNFRTRPQQFPAEQADIFLSRLNQLLYHVSPSL